MQEMIEERRRRGNVGQERWAPRGQTSGRRTQQYIYVDQCRPWENVFFFLPALCRYDTHTYNSRANKVLTVKLLGRLGGTSRATLLPDLHLM